MTSRRAFFGASVLAASAAFAPSAEPDPHFDPGKWLDQRKLGRLTTETPQAGKPLQPFAATTRAEWEKERALYEQAYRELIGSWPKARPELKPQVAVDKKTDRWIRYHVSYQTLPSPATHASTIAAWMFVPLKRDGKLAAIVALHQTLPQGKDEPAGVRASLPWLKFAEYYAERGYVTLAPDAIGYGERTAGGYAKTGFELADAAPILDRRRDMTLLGLMLYDATRAVDFLETRGEVDSNRIGVMGHSLGGILTNMVLGLEPRFQVGVASCGYGLFRKDKGFSRWAGPQSAYLPRLYLHRNDRDSLPLDFHHILALAAPRPHLIQTALGDTIWSVEAVAENAFVMRELRRVRAFHSKGAVETFVAIEPAKGAKDRNHGWYPETQKASDELFANVLR